MQVSFHGKVAIVTGVSGDGQVGQTVAKALAESGAQLAICARRQNNVEARAKELRDAGARVFAMVGSLTDEDQVQRLIDGTVDEYGRIDVLVNLAGGLSRYKTATEHTLDDWRAEVDNNMLSAFLTSRAAFPHLQAAGDGVIINFTRAGYKNGLSVSQFGLLGLHREARDQAAPTTKSIRQHGDAPADSDDLGGLCAFCWTIAQAHSLIPPRPFIIRLSRLQQTFPSQFQPTEILSADPISPFESRGPPLTAKA